MQKKEITNSMIDNFLIVLESLKIPMEIGDHATTNTTNFHPAMEGIGDTIGNIGSVIKKGWDAFWAWLKNFLNTIKTRAVKFLTDIKAKFFGKNKRKTKEECEDVIENLKYKVVQEKMKIKRIDLYNELCEMVIENLNKFGKFLNEVGHPCAWKNEDAEDIERRFVKIIEQLDDYKKQIDDASVDNVKEYRKIMDIDTELRVICVKAANLIKEEKTKDGMVDLQIFKSFMKVLRPFVNELNILSFDITDKQMFKFMVSNNIHSMFVRFGVRIEDELCSNENKYNLEDFGPIPENDMKLINSVLVKVLDIEPKIKQAADKLIQTDKDEDFEKYVIDYAATILQNVTCFQNICFKIMSSEIPSVSDTLSFRNKHMKD